MDFDQPTPEEMLVEQQRVIAALSARIDRLERNAEGQKHKQAHEHQEDSSDGDVTVDRRHMLGRVARVAAGAAAGGAALALAQATPAEAASGTFDGSPAVQATSSGGTAVKAVGVPVGIEIETEFSHLLLRNTGHGGRPAPPLEEDLIIFRRNPGEILFDVNGDLWLCLEGGYPGTWQRIGGKSVAGSLHILPVPRRMYDSRPGQLPATGRKAPLDERTPRTVDLRGTGEEVVPLQATAALVNLVATGTTSGIGGYMSIYRQGISPPSTSNLNWSGPGQTVAVTTTAGVDAAGKVVVFAGSATDVVIDVIGYYR